MPKRTDIHKILVIGSGPIVIGQAAEFDYAGTQACPRPQGRGLRGGAGQLQPRHHHDRHRHCRQGIHGAFEAGIPCQNSSLRAPGRHRTRHRRPDGASTSPCSWSARACCASARWNSWARTAPPSSAPRTGNCSRNCARNWRAGAAIAHHPLHGRGRGRGGDHRLPGGAAPGVHPRRHGRRLCLR